MSLLFDLTRRLAWPRQLTIKKEIFVMKFFSLFIIFLMNIENFKCQEDCNILGYYTCQWQIYGNDSVEYSWCDNGKYCGCAVKCTKGPHKGETCFGTCNVGWCCAKDKKSTCPGGEDQ